MPRLPTKDSLVEYLKTSFRQEATKGQLVKAFKINQDQSRKFRNLLRTLVSAKILMKKKSGKYGVYSEKKRIRGKKDFSKPKSTGPETAVGRVVLKKGSGAYFKLLHSNLQTALIPMDKNYPELQKGDLISVRIESDKNDISPVPIKKLLKNSKDSLRAHLVAVIQKAIPFAQMTREFYREFHTPGDLPRDVETEAAGFKPVNKKDYKHRKDLSKDDVIAIDPLGAQDHDDALGIKKRKGGGWLLDVHIADVAEYVTPKSQLYVEAKKRSFTRYFPWTAIPMLPKKLSTNLCSLKEGELRLAFTCQMEINAEGGIDRYEFFESLVKVKRFFTYEEALSEYSQGNPQVKLLVSLTEQLLSKRKQEGLLNFDFPETQILLDEEGAPVSAHKKPKIDSYSWIEECMLVANQCCAQFLKKNRLPGLHRVHSPPESEDIRQFFRVFREAQVKKSGNKIIEKIKKSRKNKQEELRGLYIQALEQTSENLHKKILRSLKKAEYSKSSKGHFALGFDDYAHFTSPIRRFPDLWNHRLMKEFLKGSNSLSGLQEEARAIADYSSETEIEVMKLERRANKSALCWILSDYIGAEFKGTVYDLDAMGISILLDYNFIYGDVWLPLSRLKDDYYIFDERTLSLKGRRTHRKIKLKDNLKIRLIQVDPVLGRTDFDIIKS